MTNNPINSNYEQIAEILDNSSDDNELDDEIENYNRLHTIQSTKNSVDRMMRYALKNTDINLDDEFLTNTVSVLRKQDKDFTVEDEAILWSSYQRLSILVKPATDDSILIAEILNLNAHQDSTKYSWLNYFKFWKKPKSNLEKSVNKCISDLCFIIITLIFSITFYVVIQAGCGSLSRTLNFSESVYKEWNTENNISNELKNSVNNISDTTTKNDKLLVLDYRYAASLQILANEINRMIIFRDPNGSYQSMMQEHCQDIMKNAHNPIYLQTCNIILKTHGELLYSIISQYLLPLILGIIGSTAYISRNILDQLQTNSYLPTVQGKMTMRIFLGGLLGVITGIFISTNTTTELKEFNLNLVMLSLIMGYSVDVAFSLFDQIVVRMKEWTDSLKSKQPKIQEKTNT